MTSQKYYQAYNKDQLFSNRWCFSVSKLLVPRTFLPVMWEYLKRTRHRNRILSYFVFTKGYQVKWFIIDNVEACVFSEFLGSSGPWRWSNIFKENYGASTSKVVKNESILRDKKFSLRKLLQQGIGLRVLLALRSQEQIILF